MIGMGAEMFSKSHDCTWQAELARAVDHLEAIEDSIDGIVLHAAREHGASWADVGRLLGISRQAARQRFGGRVSD